MRMNAQMHDLLSEIRQLHELGVPNKRIGERLGIHRNTVAQYLKKCPAPESSEATTLNPQETNLSGVEPKESTSNDQTGDKS